MNQEQMQAIVEAMKNIQVINDNLGNEDLLVSCVSVASVDGEVGTVVGTIMLTGGVFIWNSAL